MRLAKPHGREALEAACERALESSPWKAAIGPRPMADARSYTSVNSILKNNLHRRRPETAADGPAITHANIRGARYFH